MALLRAITSGSGGINETELWSADPSTLTSDGWNTIDLNDDMTNYNMLRIYFYKSTTDRTVEYITDIDASIMQETSGNVVRYSMGCQGNYVRDIAKTSDNSTTKLRISVAYSRTTYHGYSVTDVPPFKICGLK